MFKAGQRWYSEGEPELGLGTVIKTENRLVHVHYSVPNETRMYSSSNPPLKRYILGVGDSFIDQEQQEHTVTEVQEQNDLYFYLTAQKVVPEMELSGEIDLNGPLNRLLAQNFDPNEIFQYKYQSYLAKRLYQAFPFKGSLGPKVRLIPHQIYVVNEVLQLNSPKIMLCDEVGLGKTIEASLILNALIQQERVSNALIIVPDSLVNQWFVELYLKFNLITQTISQSTEEYDFNSYNFSIISSSRIKEDTVLFEELQNIDWQCLIIDESHQVKFEESEQEFIQLLKNINLKTKATMLLSATPEILGERALFFQLAFLEPTKYTDLDNFLEKTNKTKEISRIIKTTSLEDNYDLIKDYLSPEEFALLKSDLEIKSFLADRFGPGRIYFRNSRSNLERFSKLFNKRVLNSYPLNLTEALNDKNFFYAKTEVIFKHLTKHKEQKTLIICHSKKAVTSLQRTLLEKANFDIAIFHSGQSLLERDRQAAYFAEDDGAQCLITTEVGTEGRNFEFATHLFLFDLPTLPDQLEQRIGRLDRIGQESDIQIHVPYMKASFEELLFHWYHDVLNAFESSGKGANKFYETHHSELTQLLQKGLSSDELKSFIQEKKELYLQFTTELEQSRDYLVETLSYNHEKACEIINQIEQLQGSPELYTLTENVCEFVRIRSERLKEGVSFYAPTDNMLLPSFPGLPMDGVSLSLEREIALKHPQIGLYSYEHPFAKGIFETLTHSALGNCVAASSSQMPRGIYFEFIIGLQCVDQFKYSSSLYLPFTPLRVLLDISQQDVTAKYPIKAIANELTTTAPDALSFLNEIPRDHLVSCFEKAKQIAQTKSIKYIEKAQTTVETKMNKELVRLKNIDPELIHSQTPYEALEQEKASVISSICGAKLEIEAFRIIIADT